MNLSIVTSQVNNLHICRKEKNIIGLSLKMLETQKQYLVTYRKKRPQQAGLNVTHEYVRRNVFRATYV